MSKPTFEEQAIGTIFRLNGRSVFPALSPNIDFHHHSLPAWDETGRPVIEQGLNIESNKTQIDAPTVLVSKLNPRKPRVAVANPLQGERHCASTEFMCFSPRDKNEDLRYWAYYFGSTEFATRLQRVAVGSTNSHTRANPTEVLTWAVPTPPSEQKCAIADVLDTLDTTIRQTEAIIAKLKQVKQGLLHDLLTRGIAANGELRPPQSEAPHLYKASPLGWIPVEWSISSVDSACADVVDCPHSTPAFADAGALVARTMHIKDGRFLETIASRVSEAEYAKRIQRLEPEPGDVVFTREAPVGEAFVIPDGMRICLGQRVMLLRPSPGKLLGSFLNAQIYSGVVADRISALTAGTTNPHLNVSDVRQFILPLPPFREQVEIDARLNGLERRIRAEASQLEKLAVLKSGLMDDLLTGRVRVTPLLAQAPATQP